MTRPARSLPPRHAALALLLLALLAATAWWRWGAAPPDPGVAHLRRAAARDFSAVRADLAAALLSPRWEERAAACAILRDRPAAEAVPVLVPRASDADWRVRAAAVAALDGFLPWSGPRARDAQLDEREPALIEWLRRYDAAAHTRLSDQWCELHADLSHVEFGRPLAAHCLTCHVGTAPAAPEAEATCAGCHAALAREWAASSHAQSLSHLRLASVNPQTRQPELLDWGAPRGIGCTQCHLLAAIGSASAPGISPTTAPTSGQCRFTFSGSARDACARCHATAAAEWQAWRAQPRPVRADWPPGQIRHDTDPDARHCVDCHMPADVDAGPRLLRAHRLTARRDPDLLQRGLAVTTELRRGRGAPSVELTLTNLAGHSYPTGTRRRALAVHAGLAPEGQTPPRLGLLSPAGPGRLDPSPFLPALAPGEERAITLPWPQPDAPFTTSLIYQRHHADPQALQVEVFADQRVLHGDGRP